MAARDACAIERCEPSRKFSSFVSVSRRQPPPDPRPCFHRSFLPLSSQLSGDIFFFFPFFLFLRDINWPPRTKKARLSVSRGCNFYASFDFVFSFFQIFKNDTFLNSKFREVKERRSRVFKIERLDKRERDPVFLMF